MSKLCKDRLWAETQATQSWEHQGHESRGWTEPDWASPGGVPPPQTPSCALPSTPAQAKVAPETLECSNLNPLLPSLSFYSPQCVLGSLPIENDCPSLITTFLPSLPPPSFSLSLPESTNNRSASLCGTGIKSEESNEMLKRGTWHRLSSVFLIPFLRQGYSC